jgi:hypothetical protein
MERSYVGVLHDDEIKPAAAAPPASADTPLTALLLELGADLAEVFCREGTLLLVSGENHNTLVEHIRLQRYSHVSSAM